jgi:spore maturation protein CgeB
VPIYNGLDPATHHPAAPQPRFACDLGLVANRLPDRERRIDEFFVTVAADLPGRRFLLGGNGWADKALPPNVDRLGHLYTRDHNAFNCSALAILNVSRDSMAAYGFSPATRCSRLPGPGPA